MCDLKLSPGYCFGSKFAFIFPVSGFLVSLLKLGIVLQSQTDDDDDGKELELKGKKT